MNRMQYLESMIHDCNRRIDQLMIKYDYFSQEDKQELQKLKNQIAGMQEELQQIKMGAGFTGQVPNMANVATNNGMQQNMAYVVGNNGMQPNMTYATGNNGMQPNMVNSARMMEQPPQVAMFSEENQKNANWGRNIVRPKKNYEMILGKTLMGIFASVLIFVALVLYATVFGQLFTEEMKFGSMMVVSLAIAGVGIWKLEKNCAKHLYLALSGCGVGAIYITLFTGKIYFHLINDIVLYILLFLWCGVVYWLTKKNSVIFLSIGQIGICISILFGNMSISKEESLGKLFLIVIYFLIAEGVFLFTNLKEKFLIVTINQIGFLIGTVIYVSWIPCNDISFVSASEQMNALVRVLFVLFVLGTQALYFGNARKNDDTKMCVEIVCYLVAQTSIIQLLSGWIWGSILTAVFFVIAIEWWERKEKLGIEIIIGLAYVVAVIPLVFGMQECRTISDYSSVFIIAALTIGYAFLKNRTLYYTIGVVLLGIFTIDTTTEEWGYALFGSLLFAGVIAIFLKHMKENKIYKNVIYVFSLIFLVSNIIKVCVLIDFDDYNVIALIAAIVVFVMNSLFRQKQLVEKKLLNIINAMLMFGSLCGLKTVSDEELVIHFFWIILAMLSFSINVKIILDQNKNYFELYVGAKYTVLVYAILDSFSAPAILISIAAFVTALVVIMAGFWKRYKYLRLFGLGLSLLSIIKLLLIDISYPDELILAGAFTFCGVICFLISALYNYLSKNIQENQEM